MKVSRTALRAFGVTDEASDRFFEEIDALKQEPRRAGSLLTGAWICQTLEICPHTLYAMVDAGCFPAPVPNDE